jgi:hypothetical protein
MNSAFGAVAVLALLVGHAHADDTAMQLMQVMMKTPAISSDGKHVAIYSLTATKNPDAKTSLVVFDATGKLEQRIEIVPPATHAERAKADAANVTTLLDNGGYKRMSRVAQKDSKSDKTAFTAQLTSEDVVLDVKIAKRKVTLTGTRAGKKLKAITKALPKDGPCKATDFYSLPNTMAGFDPSTGLFAFQVTATEKTTVCFSHEFVVPLK